MNLAQIHLIHCHLLGIRVAVRLATSATGRVRQESRRVRAALQEEWRYD